MEHYQIMKDGIVFIKGVTGIILSNTVGITLVDIDLALKIVINLAIGIATVFSVLKGRISDKDNEVVRRVKKTKETEENGTNRPN